MSVKYSNVAVQEDMLPGPTLEDRFQQAAQLGVQGIEFWSESLPEQFDDIERLNGTDGVVAASINHGRRSRFLDPEPDERDRAMRELEEAIELAGRIGAAGVVYVPHFFGPLLPDLEPYKSAVELERGLLRAQIERLLETVERAGVQLWVEPVNRYETHLLVRLEQAASIVAPFDHPQLGIVADLFHMSLDEPDLPRAIASHADQIGHVHLADSNRRLPGQGTTDFAACFEALEAIGFEGWMAFECGEPGDNLPHARQYLEDLPKSLDYLFGE
ncbi:MAG: sugar phosphate isomerase/epimerase family protein [Anaerolineales bacterium]|nr:sugar phosphate isomerase/epimerase family protein [Anaerolineales bacterium]